MFWCLGHILSSPDLYRELQHDVINIDFLSLSKSMRKKLKSISFTFLSDAESFAEAFRSTMSVRRYVCIMWGQVIIMWCHVTRPRCVLETMRLHAPGMITRKVVSTHKIGVRRETGKIYKSKCHCVFPMHNRCHNYTNIFNEVFRSATSHICSLFGIWRFNCKILSV